MILIIFSSVLILTSLLGVGKIIERCLAPLNGIAEKILAGIAGVSTLWTILAFFIPLNMNIEIPTVVIGVFFFFKAQLYNEWHSFLKKNVLLFIAIFLVISFCGSYYPYILDHFGYYVPSIKWLSEYGLVKGIANLDLTLGQMSIWHIFQAGFSNFSDPFLRINVIVLITYTIYILEKKSWVQLLFLPLLFLFIQSPSPDLPVIIFSLIIVNEILSHHQNIPFLFAFSIFVFMIKPTMIWLPILSFCYTLLIVKPNWKNLVLGFALLALFFTKNIWTFGYPIFPIAIGDIGAYWKPNADILQTSSQYAIQKTYDMQYTYDEIQNFSSIDYIKNWFSLNGIKSKINALFIISLVGFCIFSWKQKNKIIQLIAFSLVIKSILILLFSAQYRFFLDVFFVIFLVVLHPYFTKRQSVLCFSLSSFFIILFLTSPSFISTHFPSYRMSFFMGKFEKEQIYRPSVYEYTPFNSFKVGNLPFNSSKNYPYNFGTPLPAISQSYLMEDIKAGIFPQLIDKDNISKGFIWKTMNAVEKKEAEHAMNVIINSNQ